MEESYIRFIRRLTGDAKIILNAAAVVIANDKNEILLQHRSDNHLWGLPGGLKELGESIQENALREVKEETSLDVRLTGFIGVFVNPEMRWRVKDTAEVICFYFTGEIIGGALAPGDDESLSLGFFDKDHLPPIHSIDNQQAIDAYFRGIRHSIEGSQF
jgi:ADP-ribose pyrophosphatase YjhB (NUDIX family)